MSFGMSVAMAIVNIVQTYALTKDKKGANIMRKVLTMAKYVNTDLLIKAGKKAAKNTNDYAAQVAMETMEKLIDIMPAADVVSMGVLEQVQWERDVAIEQLNSYGVGFAEKADVVRVVRCKDCKYSKIEEYNFPTQYFCGYTGMNWNEEDHFCSYGERKENE